jgi:hypothetical protein
MRATSATLEAEGRNWTSTTAQLPLLFVEDGDEDHREEPRRSAARERQLLGI